jgi:hypothetical protein
MAKPLAKAYKSFAFEARRKALAFLEQRNKVPFAPKAAAFDSLEGK